MAINAGLLGLLTMVRPTPAPVPPATILVTLEPLDYQTRRRDPRAPRTMPSRSDSRVAPVAAPATRAPAEPRTTEPSPQADEVATLGKVEPRWRVDDGAYLDPVTAARARRAWEAAEARRYRRACLGLSDEHLSDDEKARCWSEWAAVKPFNR